MDDRAEMFAPLPDAPEASARPAHANTRANADWLPEMPAPEEPPEAPRHARHGFPAALWTYRDATGRPLYAVCRFNLPDGGKEIQPLTFGTLSGRRGWQWKAAPKPRPLYGLDRLAARPDAPVIVTEGEKAADAASRIFTDHVAMTWPGGAQAVKHADWTPLAGRAVAVWPDNDAPGADAAAEVVKALARAGAASVAIVGMPREWPDGWDVADEAPEGVTADMLAAMLAEAKAADAGAAEPKADAPAIPPGFYMTAAGVFRRADDPEKPELHVCGPLRVEAATNDGRGTSWGVLLSWQDMDGARHEWAMPRAMLAGDGTEMRARLLDCGLFVSTGRAARDALAAYIMRAAPKARVRVVARIGWHDGEAGPVFVLPDTALGPAGANRVMLQTERPDALPPLAQRGTLAEWQSAIAEPCRGNSRLILALCAAFAAPLLHLAGAEGGGLHLRGPSSVGKTTALAVAGSVWGGGGLNGWARRWRTTDNGLESVAAAHCDLLLCLDEMGEAAPEVVSASAYMLANGGGKGRASRDGGGRRVAEWRLLFLSTGEEGLADRLAEARGGPRRVRAGQEVRVVDVPADAGAGLGLFEDCDGAEPRAFADAFKDAAGCFYGTAGRAFLDRLTKDVAGYRAALAELRDAFRKDNVPKGASGQVARVAERFALLAAAGEIAAGMGILLWPAGDAEKALATCFRAWLGGRDGGMGAAEDAEAVARVRHFIGTQDARFEEAVPKAGDAGGFEDKQRDVPGRAGWKKRYMDGWRYLILPDVWRREVIAGMDPKAAARACDRAGYLVPEGGGRLQKRERVPGLDSPVPVYVVRGAILSGEDTP